MFTVDLQSESREPMLLFNKKEMKTITTEEVLNGQPTVPIPRFFVETPEFDLPVYCIMDQMIKEPHWSLIPLRELPMKEASKQVIEKGLLRIIRMYIQNGKYRGLTVDELLNEMQKSGIGIRMFDKSTGPPPCCICTDLQFYEQRTVRKLVAGDALIYYQAYDVQRGQTLAIMVIDTSESPEHIHVLLFCANQAIPSPAARLLFALVLKKNKNEGTRRVSLIATPVGQPFYASFGFIEGKQMELDLTTWK